LVVNWTSGNEQIDNFIQEMRLKMKDYYDIVFEWISYNQFGNIEKKGKDGFMTVYSAIWNNGPLCYNNDVYTRDSNKVVDLKCLNNPQNSVESLINEV
jgi:hypothetical protein